MRTWTFQSAGSLLFGRDAIEQLPDIARGLGAKRVFIVTDAILAKTGTVEKVAGKLRSADIALDSFHVNKPEPSV
ncbi:MAG TPA: iron-containing alcohol dehydrogenase, partial [Gemmataceae bacterium]